ncbi:hypothetical protein IJ818_01295 [bacterium]|nr:hypothetical protein [bacterium]
MIQAINSATAVTTPKTLTPVKPVKKISNSLPREAKKSIDEKQNDNLLLELNYIGTQVKAILDMKAGKEVKVEKFANKLPEDEKKTPVQKQKDEAIVELGYIGDCLKKIADLNAGKSIEEKPKKTAERI